MSWKPEVRTKSDDWTGNSLRFATEREAEMSAYDLMMRWYSVTETRVVLSPDPVNYSWIEGKGLMSVLDTEPHMPAERVKV